MTVTETKSFRFKIYTVRKKDKRVVTISGLKTRRITLDRFKELIKEELVSCKKLHGKDYDVFFDYDGKL